MFKKSLPRTAPACLALIGASFITTPAFGAWLDNNLRDGLNFAVSGTVAPSLGKTHSNFRYVYPNKDIAGNPAEIEAMLAGIDRQEADERARLDGFDSAAIWLVTQKRLNRNLSLSGNVLLYGMPSGFDKGTLYYGLNLRHDTYGSLGINSGNSFDTSDITPSRTYNPLDSQSTALSLSYTQIPNLTLTGFYAFAESPNTSFVDTALHKGYGVGASYEFDFAPRHNLTLGAGYTDGKRHVDLKDDRVSKQKQATAVGINYQYQNWTLGVDAGQAKEDFDGRRIASTDSKNMGVRVGYEFTPRLSAFMSYGTKVSDKVAQQDKALDFASLATRGINESNLFDKVEQKMVRVGAEYEVYSGISINANVSSNKTTNYVSEGKFSERDSLSYNTGVTFSF